MTSEGAWLGPTQPSRCSLSPPRPSSFNSYLAYGSVSGASGLFAEAQTVVMILFFLVLIQSVYYFLITKGEDQDVGGGQPLLAA